MTSSTPSRVETRVESRPASLSRCSKPSVLVVDASVVAPIVADGGADGERLRERIRGEVLAAPDLLLSVLRRHLLARTITSHQANVAVDDLLDLPIEVYPTAPLLRQAWNLRNDITPYDACYVSLARSLECVLLTSDARLARTPNIGCTVETVPQRSSASVSPNEYGLPLPSSIT